MLAISTEHRKRENTQEQNAPSGLLTATGDADRPRFFCIGQRYGKPWQRPCTRLAQKPRGRSRSASDHVDVIWPRVQNLPKHDGYRG